MKKVCQRPTPLVELPREQDPVQVALLIHSARTAPDEDTPSVVWRIRDTFYRRTERRARALRFAVVGLVIFVMGGAVGAVVHPFLRPRPSAEPPAPTPSHEHGARRKPARLPAPPEASPPPQEQVEPPPLETPKLEAAPAAPPPALPALVTRSKPRPAPLRLAALQPALVEAVPPPAPPASNAPAPAPAPHAAEQALISGALGKLRVSHEPAAALALLDEYRTRFPQGALASEAARLRREALLLLGRKALVLDELDRTLPADATAGDERVLRGELRAAAGRWQAALADFDAVVRAYSVSGPEANDARVRDRLERALWGRAAAHSHLGNDDAVCADLGECSRRFPHGRFSAQAKQLFDKECEP